MKSPLKYQHSKKSIFGFISFGILIILGYLIYENYQLKNQLHTKEKVSFVSKNETITKKFTPFNPNHFTTKDWQNIGFSEKQSASILKYKNYLGGAFHSKEELKNCFVISEEKFNEIENAILLPETFEKKNSKNNTSYSSSFKKTIKNLTISGKFNPNHFQKTDWERIGFSEKQAISILKYKNYLGGSFHSKEELKACFVIDYEKFNQLKDYLLLPEKTEKKQFYTEEKSIPKKRIQYHNFDPNTLSKIGWKNLGFSEKQVTSILKYKNNYLKGHFKNLEEIKKCYVISDEKFEELKPYIILKTDNKISKKSIPKTKTDFSSTDLNKITFQQLVEFGFSKKAAGSFIGFRKVLGGFVNKNQVLDTYHIDKNLTQKLLKTAPLNTKNVKRYTLLNAPESWLKKHPYFKYSADKIIFYRTSYPKPTSKKIWKFIKTKDKYRQKMELYLLKD